jgi:hypothetical protein
MNESAKGPTFLLRWDRSRRQRFGRDVVQTTHRLAELAVFSDQGLAELLDGYPREAVHISTMGDNPAHPKQSRTGQLGSHSGEELIEMIRRGRLRLRLENVVQHHEKLRRIVARLYGEVSRCQPWMRSDHHEGDLEICSPAAQAYFGCDLEPNIFWQIRGCRSVWVYPSFEPFIQTRKLEEMVACGSRKPMYFEPAFDDRAKRQVQTVGDAISLLHHTPYRVVSDQHLSVTLVTKYMTRASRRRNATHSANYALNRFLPTVLHANGRYGLRAAFKRGLFRVVGTRLMETSSPPMSPTFLVDPNAPLCVGPLTPAADQSSPPQSPFTQLDLATVTSAAVASES